MQPAQADHSYAGVMFDVRPVGDWEVTLHAVHVAGQLGQVTVWIATGGWCGDGNTRRALARSGWGNANDVIDAARWQQVACVGHAEPSWHHCVEVALSQPVRVLPGSTVGIYVHSDVPGDGGIIYQSCGRSDVLAASEHVRVLPGLGHTSPTPFGTRDGWWASKGQRMRGPSGAFSYTPRERFWSVCEAAEMPRSLRAAVREVLLCHARGGAALGSLPKELLLDSVLSYCRWSWFGELSCQCPVDTPKAAPEAGGEGTQGFRGSVSGGSDDESEDGDEDEDISDALVENERLAWREQHEAEAAATRGGVGRQGSNARGRTNQASERAVREAAKQQRLDRKAEKQEKREAERLAKTAWQRTPVGASYVDRLAAAHMAAQERLVGRAAATVAPLEPEPEPEPELDVVLDAEPAVLPNAGKVRLSILSDPKTSGGGGGGKGKGGKKNKGKGGAGSKTGAGDALMLLVARSAGVESVLTSAKNKLRVKKKGGSLLVLATGVELTDAALRGLADSAELRFVPSPPPPKKG